MSATTSIERTCGTDGTAGATLDHVRRASLPWRGPADRLTECGRSAESVPSIEAAELAERIRRHGKQRTAFTVCMTCWNRAGLTSATWEKEPIAVRARELQRAGDHPMHGRLGDEKHQRMTAELRAIAALIEVHRDEFNGYLDDLAGTVDLSRARRLRARRSGGAR